MANKVEPVMDQPEPGQPEPGQPHTEMTAMTHSNTGPVIQAQPAPGQVVLAGQQWMELPDGVTGHCPSGLEYLIPLDTLKVNRRLDLLGNTKYESAAMFSVHNKMNQEIYHVWEESSFCDRCTKGADRPFTMHSLNGHEQEVFLAIRPEKCCMLSPCCGRSCLDELIVEANGAPMGYVLENRACCGGGNWEVQTADQNTVLYIGWPSVGSCFNNKKASGSYGVSSFNCTDCCEATDMIPIWNLEFEQIGVISVTVQGCCPCCKSPDYKLKMPLDLDVSLKATLLSFIFYMSVRIGFQKCC